MTEQEDKQQFIKTALRLGVAVVEKSKGLVIINVDGRELSSICHNNGSIDWSSAYDELYRVTGHYVHTDTEPSMNFDELIIYTDGGSRGNPGPSASGFVIMDSKEQIIEEGGEYLGVTTNNQAEYQAVRMALESAYKYEPSKIYFRIDSLLVVNQMIGKFKIKNKDLWPINSAIHRLIDQNTAKVEFTHVRREFNKLADAKVNEILDARSI